VHEILHRLGPGDRVLDLGCASGSFPQADTAATVFRADLSMQTVERFVCCDARTLPFKDQSFNAVIMNHSLEHFENPENVLKEVRRVLGDPAFLYVAVPDASTFTDRVYRWLGRGGGHVNPFSNVDALVELIKTQTGLAHIGTRLLFTSLSFLNRRNWKTKPPLRVYLVGGGSERILRLATPIFRVFDKLAGTRTSIYGWACCFGPPMDFDTRARRNVCVRCGSGHSSETLLESGTVRQAALGMQLFRCPLCGADNYFTDDRTYFT
jgi:SAM-dependent methyltransferase